MATETIEADMFSPCPGCDTIGYAINRFRVFSNDKRVKLMRCDTPNDDCRVDTYMPRIPDSEEVPIRG